MHNSTVISQLVVARQRALSVLELLNIGTNNANTIVSDWLYPVESGQRDSTSFPGWIELKSDDELLKLLFDIHGRWNVALQRHLALQLGKLIELTTAMKWGPSPVEAGAQLLAAFKGPQFYYDLKLDARVREIMEKPTMPIGSESAWLELQVREMLRSATRLSQESRGVGVVATVLGALVHPPSPYPSDFQVPDGIWWWARNIQLYPALAAPYKLLALQAELGLVITDSLVKEKREALLRQYKGWRRNHRPKK